MKFSFKIVIGTMLIVVAMFSLSGIILIHENFKNSYHLQMNTNIAEHYLEKYSIESNINENILADGTIDNKELENYLYILTSYLDNSRKLLIYVNDEVIWDNVPFEIDKNAINNRSIEHYEAKKYSIISSSISINDENILITSVYDISGIFKVRDQNLNVFYIIDIILLILCGFLTTIFAKFLTRPIHELNHITKTIASGNLDIKIDIKSNDEIGELAGSFNVMVESIRSKINELELSVKQREDFVSNFTHELKTPMTSIMGYAKVLKQNKYTKENKEKAADYIYSETKRLEILSYKLLDLMKLSENRIKLDRIYTKEFFDTIKEIAWKRLDHLNLSINIEKCTILGDKELLITCLMNLLENSKKASEKDAEIKIVGTLNKGKYQIAVIDHGVGIDKDEIKRITESFYMVDKARNKSKGGYGIGLSLASKIAKLHNTELIFKSEVGKGTTVSLKLEVVKGDGK